MEDTHREETSDIQIVLLYAIDDLLSIKFIKYNCILITWCALIDKFLSNFFTKSTQNVNFN